MGSTFSAAGPAAAAPTSEGGALDVHAHAMPLPLLQRLADRGLADLAGVADGVVRLDPRVSGVGPLAPLPLARSQYDVDVRLSEMDEVGVHRHAVSLPPFLFASTADDRRFATDIVAQGNDELADLRRGRARTAPGARLGTARLAGRGRGGPAGARRPRDGRDRDREPRWWPRPRRPRQRRPLGPAVRAARVRVPAPQRRSGPAPAGGLLAAPARRLPDGDRARGGPAGVRPGARAVPAPPVPGPRWRLPARAARPPGHGLGAQGRRPHDLGPAERVHRPALLRHGGLLLAAAAAPRRGRRRGPRPARHRPPLRARGPDTARDRAEPRARPRLDAGDPVGQRGRPARPPVPS